MEIKEATLDEKKDGVVTRKHTMRDRKIMVLLIAFVSLLHLGLIVLVVQHPDLSIRPDSYGYRSLAESLLQGNGFVAPGSETLGLSRTPGYPVFLALLFSIFGSISWPVALLQEAVLVLVGLLLYLIASSMREEDVGLWAALIFGLMINPAVWALTLLTEVLFTLLVVLSFFLLYKALSSPRVVWLVASGLTLGVATLIRPSGLMLLPAWCALFLYANRKVLGQWKPWSNAAILCAGFFLMTLPWMIRNQIVWDRFTLSSISHINLGAYLAAGTLEEAEGISLEQARAMLPLSDVPQPGQKQAYLDVILSHPQAFMSQYIKGTLAMLLGYGRTTLAQIWGEPFPVGQALDSLRAGDWQGIWVLLQSANVGALASMLLLPGLQAIIYVFAGAGFVSMFRQGGDQRSLAIGIAFICLLILAPVGHVGNARFRVPLEPFLAYLVAAWISPRCPIHLNNRGSISN